MRRVPRNRERRVGCAQLTGHPIPHFHGSTLAGLHGLPLRGWKQCQRPVLRLTPPHSHASHA